MEQDIYSSAEDLLNAIGVDPDELGQDLLAKVQGAIDDGIVVPEEVVTGFKDIDPASVQEVTEEEFNPVDAQRLERDLSADAQWNHGAHQFKLLTAEEEVRLAKRIEMGDLSAKEEFVNRNLRLVASIAARFQGHGMDLEDLKQEGVLGLMRAVDKFDYRKGYKFSTYATWWIRQAVMRSLHDKSKVVRIPVHQNEKLRRLAEMTVDLTQELNRHPTTEEILDYTGLSAEEYAKLKLLQVQTSMVSLDRPVKEGSEETVGDFVPWEDSATVTDRVISSTVVEKLWELLGQLDERDRTVLELRFGLKGRQPQTLEVVGQKYGVTRERIRQIEAKALLRLANLSGVSELRQSLKK